MSSLPYFSVHVPLYLWNSEQPTHGAAVPCRPIIRSVMMIAFLVYFIVTVVTSPVGTSHLSHVGGFVSGLFPALLFLPHLRSERCAVHTPANVLLSGA